MGIDARAATRSGAGLVERPRLHDALDRGAAVTLVCAPAGSGKSVLLRSWLRGAGPAAWVSVDRGESDAARFWSLVIDALRSSGAIAAGDPLATLVPAPQGGQDEFLERLIEGLGRLREPVHLVVDDLHQLRSDAALAGLEQLIGRAPSQLRTVISTRRDPKLGLHRLRLSGALTEIRAADLEFTGEETAALIAGAGVALDPADLERLHGRTEGWAAGLRLAALSLARHDAPSRFVAEFSGSERTVADYLLGEVLESQPPEVRHLLLRTCVLERVNGPLADLLTGRRDGTRLLHELEEANALVVADDVARSWFRYHHLLADLLRLELRREAPDDVAALHRLAAGWHAEHGSAVAAIRHASRGEDWELAAELIGRHWAQLILDGEEATLAGLLAGLPAHVVEADAEVATVAAVDRLWAARWKEADALLDSAALAIRAVPAGRRDRARTALGTVQILRARHLGNAGEVLDAAVALLEGAGGVDPDLEALAVLNLGVSEAWTLRLADAEAHLAHGIELAGRIGRPYVEVGCLTALGMVANMTRRPELAEQQLGQAIAVAERLGWATHAVVGPAYVTLAAVVLDRGRLTEADECVARAGPILAGGAEPAATVGLHNCRGMLAMARGRYEEARAAWAEAERLARTLRAPHFLEPIARQWQRRAGLRLGEPPGHPEEGAAGRNITAHAALAAGHAEAAIAAVAPVLDGTLFALHVNLEIEAHVLDALARKQLGDAAAAERSLERALALGEPHGRVYIWLTIPGAAELLAAHPVHRTRHAAYSKELLDRLAGAEPEAYHHLDEDLRERELAVLRFLPTNLSAAEIGNELFLSVHTVKTHMRKLYAKLDVHTRAEAVQRGRALGLLAPARRA